MIVLLYILSKHEPRRHHTSDQFDDSPNRVPPDHQKMHLCLEGSFVDENADLEVMGTNQTAIALGFQKYSARQTGIYTVIHLLVVDVSCVF